MFSSATDKSSTFCVKYFVFLAYYNVYNRYSIFDKKVITLAVYLGYIIASASRSTCFAF